MTDSEEVDTLILVILLVSELVIFILCVFGNAVVCYVMIFREKLKSSASMYILSISVADLLVGLIAIPTGGLQAVHHQPHNFEACLTLLLLVVVVSGASLTSVFALTVGRFWAICFPFSYHSFNTFRLNGIIIAISWIFPVLTIMPLLFDYGIKERFDNKCRMTTILSFHAMWLQSFSVLMYVALLIVLHCVMYRTLLKQASAQ
jgi:7 transmembrane receptor (rhodopsin family)